VFPNFATSRERTYETSRDFRRGVLAGAGAIFAGTAFSTRVMADAPPAEPVTPALIEAAKKEGQVIYTLDRLPVAEKRPGV